MSRVTASRVLSRAELCLMEPVPEPCSIVVFGASGDLAFRKLIPALFHLHQQSLMPREWNLVGFGRSGLSDDSFRVRGREALSAWGNAGARDDFLGRLSFVSGDYADSAAYGRLKARLAALDAGKPTAGRTVFVLATPPAVFQDIAARLGAAGLSRPGSPGGWARLAVEKPFGSDLASARRLNDSLRAAFGEGRVFRVDHYLGKETVQNILALRFANAIFEPSWNRNYVERVEILAAEAAGVEGRGAYYDSAGVVRDMFQNHLLQLLALTGMEPPSRLEPEPVRGAKADLLRAVREVGGEHVGLCAVRAQYDASGDGSMRAYRAERGVRPDSATPTFAAVRLEVDNWRWQGVPFVLVSGKRLPRRLTEVVVRFKRVPVSIFAPMRAEQLPPNVLRLRIQPDEGVSISFEAKHPGPKLCLSTVTMDFDYKATFGTEPPEAYARVLLDVMTGDQTLFTRTDEMEEAWRILDPLVRAWEEAGDEGLLRYPAGTPGPAEAGGLLQPPGR